MTVAVVSFYTPTWEYPEHAARLTRECDALGLPHHIVELPDAGSYLANTRLKPTFLRDTMAELDRPLLWIDVDGSIFARPDALRYDVDFMGRLMPASRDRKWHVGTLYFNATGPAKALLQAWDEAAQRGSDEAAFDVAWQTFTGSHAELPASYFDVLGPSDQPAPDTVICHRLSTSESKLRLHGRIA